MLAACLIVAASASAAPAVTIQVSGSTVTMTQTADGVFTVTRTSSGDFEVYDGSTQTAPARDNLVVKTLLDGSVTVILDSALPGNLAVDMPGGFLQILGAVPTIGGNLKVTGRNDVTENVVMGSSGGSPVAVTGNASFDFGSGNDIWHVHEFTEIHGSLKIKGSNTTRILAPLVVHGKMTMNTKAETLPTDFFVDSELLVEGNFSYSGNGEADEFEIESGGSATFRRNATINLGNTVAFPLPQELRLPNTEVDGKLKIRAGKGAQNVISTDDFTVIGGSADIKGQADDNDVVLDGVWDFATAVKYVGGKGRDTVDFLVDASNATFTFIGDDGDDTLILHDTETDMASFLGNFGPGTDMLVDNGYVLPPGSVVTGLPCDAPRRAVA